MSKEFTIKYKFPDDYNPIYVNGAFGAISPRNELVVNFFLERIPLPKKEIIEVSDTGEVMETKGFDPDDFQNSVIRYVQSGIVLSNQGAKELHQWLGEHLEKFEQKKEK